jgi:hypothetical protein
MADAQEGTGDKAEQKRDRGLFASARKLARAAVTRAIERLTGMPLSGDPWAPKRGLLDAPAVASPPSAPPPPAPRPPIAPVRAETVPGVGPSAPPPARKPKTTNGPSAHPIVMSVHAATPPPRPATGPVATPAPAPPIPDPTAPPEPPPRHAPEEEPFGILDFEETVETYGVDEVAVMARDPRTLFVYWEVTPAAWERARAHLGGEGVLTLRLFVTPMQGQDFVHDTRLNWDHGRRYVDAPARNARVAAAVGLLASDGRFAAMAFAPPTMVPSGTVSPNAAEEWMDVAPAGLPGWSKVPPRIRAIGTLQQILASLAAAGRTLGRRRGAARLPTDLYQVDEGTTTSSRGAGTGAWPSSPSVSSPGKMVP